MIEYKEGSIFSEEADIYSNAINCRGVCGAGLALSMKKRFPETMEPYKDACESGLRPGQVLVTYTNCGKTILNAATKDHWKNPSRYQWVEECYKKIKEYLNNIEKPLKVHLVYLGCGLGNLDKTVVKPMIDKHLGDCKHNIVIWE